MNTQTFFTRLAGITLMTASLLFVLHAMAPEAQQHVVFSVWSIGLFLVICIGLYYAGSASARSTNKFAFSNLVSVSVFGKMVIALVFLLIYQKTMHPQNNWFVGIFLFCYVVYTVFEVWFMSILARMK
jgi:hypothetical protein